MRKILWLARREYLAAVKTKGFIIALIFAPVVMSGSALAMFLFGDKVDTTDKRIAVIDRSGIALAGLIEAAERRNADVVFDEVSGNKVRPAYLIEEVQPDLDDPIGLRLKLSDRVRRGELSGFVEIGRSVMHPRQDTTDNRVRYYSRSAAMDPFPDWMAWPLNSHLRRERMVEVGVDSSVIDDVVMYLGVEERGLATTDETGLIRDAEKSNRAKAVLIPIGIMMLMFFMIMMGGGSMLQTVMEEKTQRIAEVLLGSIRPFDFMMGKLLGGIGVSLTASSVYILAAVVVVTLAGATDQIPFHAIPWFLIYMLLAIFMFGSVFGMLGAICNEPKDAQNLMFPAMAPMMIPMFLMVPVIKEPVSSFATALSLFPPFTPTLMLARMVTPMEIPAWQPWVGLVGVILFTLASVWIGGRIFRIGILMQGKPPHLKDLVRWAVRG